MRECPRCELCFEDDVLTCPDDEVNTKQTLPGTRLLATRYLLEKRLGRGAMGQVYLARDQNLQTRRVAVKTVRPDILNDEDMQEGEAIARFEREARAAASVRHPNVVDVTDFGKSAEGVFFLVMDVEAFAGAGHFLQEVTGLAENVRACPRVEGVEEIILPGDPERREKQRRSQTGLTLDDGTWGQLVELAEQLKVKAPTA